MNNCAKMKPVHKVTEDHIFPHDLKMWAKSAGRKFKEAYDRVVALEKKDITINAYWDADNNPSGVYFVRMIAGEFVKVQRITLIK